MKPLAENSVLSGGKGVYTIIKKIGEGGNADVFSAKDDNQRAIAIKCIKDNREYSLKRFKREIDSVNKLVNLGLDRIIPIIDFELNESKKKNNWYAMPLASNLDIVENTKNRAKISNQKINWVIDVCEILVNLHNLGYSHRDIKPDNILMYNNKVYLSDFGLVSDPLSEERITQIDRKLGPNITIAPEMKRNPYGSDGMKADVYSFAKTIWIIFTGNDKCFDGQYMILDKEMSLSAYFSDEHLVEIDRLISECTYNDPKLRPDILKVKEYLDTWITLREKSWTRVDTDWHLLNEYTMSRRNNVDVLIWFGKDEIIDVLSKAAIRNGMNHMFIHTGGGMDLVSVEKAYESGFLKLILEPNEIIIIKPKKLSFYNMYGDEKWAYFILEAENITPIFSETLTEDGEDLIALDNGEYRNAEFIPYFKSKLFDAFVVKGNEEIITRYGSSKYAIFSKNSDFNLLDDSLTGAYFGIHGKLDENVFRNLILLLKNKSHKKARDIVSKFLESNSSFESLEVQVEKENINDLILQKKVVIPTYRTLLKSNNDNQSVKYKILLYINELGLIENERKYFLNKEGFFTEYNVDCFECNDEELLRYISELKVELYKHYENNLSLNFRIEVEVVSQAVKPLRITFDEFLKSIRELNDSRGYVCYISYESKLRFVKYFEYMIGIAPVYLPLVPAFQNLVGKYVDENNVIDYYNSILSGWIEYFKTGRITKCLTIKSENSIIELNEIIEKINFRL